MQETIPEETITISRTDYDKLVEDQVLLDTLFAYGVENWEGYEEARQHAYA